MSTVPPSRPQPLGVALFPPPKQTQPAAFLSVLEHAIEAAGVVRVRGTGPLSLRWSARQTDAQVVHLHWLEFLAAPDPRPGVGAVVTWLRVARLITSLAILRLRGVGLVWTVHNLEPHEAVRPRSQAVVAQAVYLLVDELIVHSEYAAVRVRDRFRGRRGRAACVIPHPNYVGAFPATSRNREQVRADLGLAPDAFVYLAFGVIRDYKRLPMLAAEFEGLAGDELVLLIAGVGASASEVAALRAIAARDPRIVLHPEHVPDGDVAALHLAADAAVLAYADVFSSGALLLALSYGVPVVAPADGTARELFTPPAVELFGEGELTSALDRVRAGERRDAAAHAAARFPWSEAGLATVDVYYRATTPRGR